MADKSIDQLNEAEKIYATDLFVLQQSGSAKKLTGQVLLNWLTAAADGHGGIQSIAKLSTSGLEDTYRITLADTTTFDFVVTNGRSINSIAKTYTSGLVDTYTITYNNGTTSKFSVTNGAKGDKGDNAYVWIKYASQEPTESSHSMGDIPDNWIGIYSGNASTAPTDWKQYKWFKHKGEKGDTGTPATLVSKSVTYQVNDSGTIIPSGAWGSSIPVVSQGKYLWTKTELQFNTGDPIVSYSVARMGIDGSGSVSSVSGVSPDSNGNVTLTAADVGALAVSGGDLTGELRMNGQPISGLNEPTEGTQAAPKSYVDKRVPLDGSKPMAGNLAMGGNKITNLADPEDATDAATKWYADTKAALPKTASGTVIALSDASDGPLQGLRIYGRTTQNGTPTPEAPVELVSVSNPNIVFYSNLFDKNNVVDSWIVNSDGSENSNATWSTSNFIGILPNSYIYFSISERVRNQLAIHEYDANKSFIISNRADNRETANPFLAVKTTPDTRYVRVGYRNDLGTKELLLNYGTERITYSEYKEPQVFAIPCALNAIPVTSGGNYTDADGQQWICDEVDFARGVYVQRIGTIDSYAGEAVSEPYLSTTGALSTGAKVLYVLATPIETQIPEDELAAYTALHTNKPNTTIYNDAGAHMDVGYYPPDATMRQEDIKEYVDGKHFIATVSLPAASWVGDAAPYTQTVSVPGILATDFPHVTPVYSSTLATALAQKEAWSMVSKGEPGAGKITFTCFEEKPATEIPIQIEVMR